GPGMPAASKISADVLEAATLRAEVAELRRQLAAATPRSETTQAASADDLQAVRRRALDRTNPSANRLAALGELRSLNARDAEVVSAMIDLARQSSDSAIRADVFRQLNGISEPRLKEPLITALSGDQSSDVRSEAAETLEGFRDDPEVHALLEKAGRSDPNYEVKAAAVEALLNDRPFEVLATALANTESSDLERYVAATQLRKTSGPSTEQAKALVGVLNNSSNPKLREEVVEDLSRHYAHVDGVRQWMEHLAATDPNSKVQEEASEFLERSKR
ncbi:MAG TPA: HEAT repeat domain-containing protein, partial [Chthoniobacteraceae bacterium]|nr:HEAT repeat domain-containing protein [Chthoniobacteraceae bacterium]